MLFEILKETNYLKNVEYIGGNPDSIKKVRYLYAILGIIIGGILIYTTKMLLLAVALPVLGYMGYKYPYYSVLNKKKFAESVNRHLFTDFIGTFLSVMPTSGNVYQTLLATREYTPEPLLTGLNRLIDNLAIDNERKHYVEFSDFVGGSEASMVMDILYQFSYMGVEDSVLKRLEDYSFEIEKNMQDELIETKLTRMQYLGYVPIFITIAFILVFVGVMFTEFFSPIMDSIF